MAIDKGHEDELKAINQALADLKADGRITSSIKNGSASIQQRKNCNRIWPRLYQTLCSLVCKKIWYAEENRVKGFLSQFRQKTLPLR